MADTIANFLLLTLFGRLAKTDMQVRTTFLHGFHPQNKAFLTGNGPHECLILTTVGWASFPWFCFLCFLLFPVHLWNSVWTLNARIALFFPDRQSHALSFCNIWIWTKHLMCLMFLNEVKMCQLAADPKPDQIWSEVTFTRQSWQEASRMGALDHSEITEHSYIQSAVLFITM